MSGNQSRNYQVNLPKYQYITKLYAGETIEMQKAANSIPIQLQQIAVSPLEGKIIEVLLKTIRPQRILELGTLAGYSTLWLLNSLVSGGEILTIEKNPRHAALATRNLAAAGDNGRRKEDCQLSAIAPYHYSTTRIYSKKITVWLGEAEKLLGMIAENWLLNQPLDAMFIDADKKNYQQYFAFASEYLRPGGLLLIDNTLKFGNVSVYEEDNKNLNQKNVDAKEQMLDFNSFVAKSDRFDSIILPTDSGLTLAVKLW